MSKSLSLFSLTLLLAVVVLFTGAGVVSAANQVVSDCGDNGGANQLRAKIDSAQSSGGGTITFTCGPLLHCWAASCQRFTQMSLSTVAQSPSAATTPLATLSWRTERSR